MPCIAQFGLSESGKWNNKGMKLRDEAMKSGDGKKIDERKIDQAIKCFENAIELDPQYNRAYVNMGEVYASAFGDDSKAKFCFEKAIEIDPNDPFAWHNMATIMDRSNDLRRAVSACKRALKLESPSTEKSKDDQKKINDLKFKTLATLTNIYLRMKCFDDARETLSKLQSHSEAGSPANKAEIERLQSILRLQGHI